MKLSNEERISEVIGFTKDNHIIFAPYISNIFNIPTSPINWCTSYRNKEKIFSCSKKMKLSDEIKLSEVTEGIFPPLNIPTRKRTSTE